MEQLFNRGEEYRHVCPHCTSSGRVVLNASEVGR